MSMRFHSWNGVAQNIDMVTETLDLALNVIDFSISSVAPNIPGEKQCDGSGMKDGEVVLMRNSS